MRRGCESQARMMKARPGLQGDGGRRRTHHSLPQDQALRGVGVDLELDGLGRIEGTRKETRMKEKRKRKPNQSKAFMECWSDHRTSQQQSNIRRYLLGKTDFGRAMYPSLWK